MQKRGNLPETVTGSGISRNTKLLGTASFLNDVSSEMIFPLLPFFLTGILRAPVFVIGLIEGIGEITASLAGFFSGVYSDKTGNRKRPIIGGYALSGVMKGFIAFVSSWHPVVPIRFFERFGKGMREAPRDALIGLSEKEGNVGKAFGYRKAMDSAGAIVGPLIAVFLLAYFAGSGAGQEQAYRWIFLIAVIPAVFAVIALFFLKEVKTEKKDGKAGELIGEVLKAENFRFLLIAAFILSLGQFSVAFFVLKGGAYMNLLFVPIAYMAYNVVYTVSALPAGKFADMFGAKLAMTIAAVSLLLVLFGFSFFPSIGTIFLLFALMGVYMAIIETAPRVFVVKTVDKTHYATGMGIYGAVAGIAALPANLIAGALWDVSAFGTNATFIFSMITTIIAVAVIHLKMRER